MLIYFNFLDNSSNKCLSWEVVKYKAVKHDIYEKHFLFITFTVLLNTNQSRRSGVLINNSDTLVLFLLA